MYMDEVRTVHARMRSWIDDAYHQNGWPWKTGPSVQPNGPNAVANKKNQKGYYDLLDEHCQDFKAFVGGGVGWFAHIYSDAQESEYGILDASKEPKFKFSPRTHC